MAYARITAEEAASFIKDGDNIAIGGFTPNGDPKAVFRELSKKAIREHEQGRPFKVGIFSEHRVVRALKATWQRLTP